jgi:hypothetical protein
LRPCLSVSDRIDQTFPFFRAVPFESFLHPTGSPGLIVELKPILIFAAWFPAYVNDISKPSR